VLDLNQERQRLYASLQRLLSQPANIQTERETYWTYKIVKNDVFMRHCNKDKEDWLQTAIDLISSCTVMYKEW